MNQNLNNDFLCYSLDVTSKNKLNIQNSSLEYPNIEGIINIFNQSEVTLIYSDNSDSKPLLYDKIFKCLKKKDDVFFINSSKKLSKEDFKVKTIKERFLVNKEIFTSENEIKFLRSFFKIIDFSISKKLKQINIYHWNLFDNYSYENTKYMLRIIKSEINHLDIDIRIIGFTHNYEIANLVLSDNYIKENTFTLIKLDNNFKQNKNIYILKDKKIKTQDNILKMKRLIDVFTKNFNYYYYTKQLQGLDFKKIETSKDLLIALDNDSIKYEKSILLKWCYQFGIRDVNSMLKKYSSKEEYIALKN